MPMKIRDLIRIVEKMAGRLSVKPAAIGSIIIRSNLVQ